MQELSPWIPLEVSDDEETPYLWSILLKKLSHYLARWEMVRESLILTISSNSANAKSHRFSSRRSGYTGISRRKVYHDLMKRIATQCQHVFDEMMKYYKTCCLKYFLQSIKEYIQESNIKFHKSRPDFLLMLNKKTKLKGKKSCNLREMTFI